MNTDYAVVLLHGCGLQSEFQFWHIVVVERCHNLSGVVARSCCRELINSCELRLVVIDSLHVKSGRGLSGRNRESCWIAEASAAVVTYSDNKVILGCAIHGECQRKGVALVQVVVRSRYGNSRVLVINDLKVALYGIVPIAANGNCNQRLVVENVVVCQVDIECRGRLSSGNRDLRGDTQTAV